MTIEFRLAITSSGCEVLTMTVGSRPESVPNEFGSGKINRIKSGGGINLY